MTAQSVVNLPIPLDSDLGHEFIVAMARYADGLISEKSVRAKYQLDEHVWEALGANEKLVEAIEAEKERRIKDGSTKRERAQRHVTRAPDILNNIMHDERASPRHRVDAAKALDGFAANGPERPAPGAHFLMKIDLTAGGGDVETYDKSIEIKPNDVDPDNTDTAPLIVAAIAEKKGDGNGGQPI